MALLHVDHHFWNDNRNTIRQLIWRPSDEITEGDINPIISKIGHSGSYIHRALFQMSVVNLPPAGSVLVGSATLSLYLLYNGLLEGQASNCYRLFLPWSKANATPLIRISPIEWDTLGVWQGIGGGSEHSATLATTVLDHTAAVGERVEIDLGPITRADLVQGLFIKLTEDLIEEDGGSIAYSGSNEPTADQRPILRYDYEPPHLEGLLSMGVS